MCALKRSSRPLRLLIHPPQGALHRLDLSALSTSLCACVDVTAEVSFSLGATDPPPLCDNAVIRGHDNPHAAVPVLTAAGVSSSDAPCDGATFAGSFSELST